jgi:hypothetical protein
MAVRKKTLLIIEIHLIDSDFTKQKQKCIVHCNGKSDEYYDTLQVLLQFYFAYNHFDRQQNFVFYCISQ